MNESEPTNTAAQDPLLTLVEAMGSPDGFIEAMESRGQQELLASEVLPTEILWCTQADMEALGFVFGDEVPGDPLFRHVTLPEGWARKGSEHAMWSYIVDQRGIERVAVFYKAAFYDRSAHMGIQNVGYTLAQKWIYGDDEPALPDNLLPDELDAVRESAERYIDNARRNPDIYGERLPRAESLLQAVTK